MWTTMSDKFSYPRAVIGVLADAWDIAVINMVFEVSVIVVRDNTVTDELTGVMVGVDVDTLDVVGIIVVAAVVIALMTILIFVTTPSEEPTPSAW